MATANKLKEWREKLKKFCRFDEDILHVKYMGQMIQISNINIGKFTISEIEEMVEKIKTKEVREVIQQFLEFVKKKIGSEAKLKIRPKYINISFSVNKKDLKLFSRWLQSNPDFSSFREFVVKELSRRFDIPEPPDFFFSIKSKKSVGSPQVLLPEKFFNEILKRKNWSRREGREKISQEIAKIIMDKVKVMRRWRNW